MDVRFGGMNFPPMLFDDSKLRCSASEQTEKPRFVADDFAAIAAELKEIEREKEEARKKVVDDYVLGSA